MADFPASVFSPRARDDRSGVVYDADKKTVLFNKDLTDIENEVIAVETERLAQSGWTPANATWSYASASTITVPSGAASKYQKGDKIKFTQNGTVKYFYIIAVADTLLTVTAGSDFSVENTATYPITANYFSHEQNPIGFPQWFNYTVIHGGYSSDPTYAARFCILNGQCHVKTIATAIGTSNAINLTFTLPVNCAIAQKFLTVCGIDNGSTEFGSAKAVLVAASNIVTCYKNVDETFWTNSGTKYITQSNFIYEI